MANEPDYQRFISSHIRGEELETLQAITEPNHIKTFEILGEWTDDREPCLGVSLNGVQFGIWWIVREFVRELYRIDDNATSTSKKVVKAKEELIDYLQYEINEAKEEVAFEDASQKGLSFLEERSIDQIRVERTHDYLDGRSSPARVWNNPEIARRTWSDNYTFYYLGGSYASVDLTFVSGDDKVENVFFTFTVGDLVDRRHTPRQSSVRVWNALRTLVKTPSDPKAIKVIQKAAIAQLDNRVHNQ